MLAPRLQKGDTIGLCAPSWVQSAESIAPVIHALEAMGYHVKCADHLLARGWGYAASPEERAADINQLIGDEDVRLIFFGGGEGAEDVLDSICYEAAARHPKIWLSYSDGTSILNAVHSRTGLVTYYGQMPGLMPWMSDYDGAQFAAHIQGLGERHTASGPWRVLRPGRAEGTLLGGYVDNFAYMARSGELSLPQEKYILFLEDHRQFVGVEAFSARLGRLERAALMHKVTGVLFGHYGEDVDAYVLERMRRLGERWHIPVAYCDDFGHGSNHAILPIGASAVLDTESQSLSYRW